MPDLTPGASYTVRLHFAETYFTTLGQRLVDIAINGTTVLSNFDVATAAGAVNKALVEQFTVPADTSGNITITLTTVSNFPLINGVEILKSVPSVGTTSFLYDPNGSLRIYSNQADFLKEEQTSNIKNLRLTFGKVPTRTTGDTIVALL